MPPSPPLFSIVVKFTLGHLLASYLFERDFALFLLLVDEMKNLAAELKAREGITPSDVKYIVPQSAEMITLVIKINKPIDTEYLNTLQSLPRQPIEHIACISQM